MGDAMTTRCGWAGAALLAAAFTMTALPAVAQDGPQKPGTAKKKKVDWAKKRREAEKKKAAAEKKRAEAEKAAEEAEKAEAEAVAAEEEAEPPAQEELEAADEGAEAPADKDAEEAVEAEEAEEAVVVEDEPEQKAPKRKTRKRRTHRHDHGHVPSPERAAPMPYRWAGPYTMEYVEGAQIPDGYTKVERVRKGLVIGGAVTLGVGWLIASTAAASIDEDIEDETAPLFIPVVGPFIAMGTLEAEGAGRAALFVNGMAQVAGAAMLIGGIAATKTVLVRTKTAEINVRPGLGNLQLDGTF